MAGASAGLCLGDLTCCAACRWQDYLALAAEYHTVFLTDIPALDLDSVNPLRRLITLIDALYENKVKVIMSAEVPAHAIFRPDTAAKDSDKVP